ncbi:MAG: hypothetical protein ACKVOP_01150 [Sphingomonadaceae bacterium]
MSASAAGAGAPERPQAAMLPDRTLTCIVGRSIGVDQNKWQTTKDVKSEGQHRIVLRLPARPAHVGDLPDPTDVPEPIDPETKIVSDPDGITANVAKTFSRVVDLWPQRVEIIAAIRDSAWQHVMIVDPIDPKTGRAHLFMAPVKDAATMDLQRIYQGSCKISGAPTQLSAR